jgi:hypothetical protein
MQLSEKGIQETKQCLEEEGREFGFCHIEFGVLIRHWVVGIVRLRYKRKTRSGHVEIVLEGLNI